MAGLFIFWSEGRLGNQMAQYAFCHALALQRGERFIFVARYLELDKHFHLGSPQEYLRLSGRWAWAAERILPHAFPVTRVDAGDLPVDALAAIHGCKSIAGFFQSEQFMGGSNDQIHEFFKLAPKAQRRTDEVRRRRGWCDLSKVAVIHVRRGDYLSFGNVRLGGVDLALPSTWFQSACVSLLGLSIERAVVISDDRAWCHNELRLPWPWEYSGEDMITDLSLLRDAAACVLSPSSFSWWGAWLNRRPDRVVVAPRCWLGHRVGRDYPPMVIPSSWIQV